MIQPNLLPLLLSAVLGQSQPAATSAIGVREGLFVHRTTHERFTPRGFNYIRLFPGRSHNTFDPEHYDPAAIEKTFQQWQADGFNAVRVFLNSAPHLDGTAAAKGRPGLDPAYVRNVADFLDRAGRHGIAVMLCTESFPHSLPYRDTLEKNDPATMSTPNAEYLSAGHVKAKTRFLKDLIAELKAQRPGCLGAIFSYDLQNEFCYQVGPPFTLTSGSVTSANGKTYTLPGQRQELADDGAVHFINAMADAIHEVHPGALVSASVFTYAAVGKRGPGDFTPDRAAWKNRVPFRPLAILRSKADFLDLHFYPADAAGWQRDLDSVEFDQVELLARQLGKPIVVGEFGAFKRVWPDPVKAAAWMADLAGRVADRGFAGWIYWTFDTHEQDAELWHACAADRAIYNVLRPVRSRGPAAVD